MTDEQLFPTPSTTDSFDPVQGVFDYWVETCRSSGRGPKPALSDKRKRIIRKALDLHEYQTLLEAIKGVTMSDWHMGNNPRGKKYDSIELILRDAEKIEQFAGYFHDQDADDPFSGFFE